jgi:predicted metal-dependent hydrolase
VSWKAKKPKILRFGDREVEIWCRRNRRSRHMILSLDAAEGVFRLTLPQGITVEEGLAFAAQKRRWILARLDELPPRVPFAPGAIVPFLGEPHLIVHEPLVRRGVWRENGAIHACGLAEHVARRVRDHLKREARAILLPRTHDKAQRIDCPVAHVGLRDPRTRWGSCSSDGTISLSWRLILAPEEVLDYVVAHEVAHLVHQDHGRAFWRLVGELTPSVAGPQRWLKSHGPELHRYG